MGDDEFESRVLRFERAWREGGPCDIAAYLGVPAASCSPGRLRLLLELIGIDLEFRWRGGVAPATLSSYVARFPELVSLDRLPPWLLGEEYRARRLWGDKPSHAEFLTRFSEGWEQVRPELLRVDAEIAEDAAGPLPIPGPALAAKGVERLDPGNPLLSHGDFVLRRLIGSGRMGKVYEAGQLGSGGEVAVKFLRKSLLHRPEVVGRFLGEARTVAGLRHPNIVGSRGLGRTPGGSYFLVMDLVPGPDLARLCDRRVIEVDEAVRWAIGICRALEHAHGRGVVHCDLKPANVLLDAGGQARVADFGLARSLAGDTPWTAEVEGTVPFMAPEQGSRSWGPVDERTDVYGLGAVLFTLLTGRPPFAGRRLADVLAEVVSGTPVVPPSSLRPGLPGPLNDLCRRCLAKSPGARFGSVRDIRQALEGLLDPRTAGGTALGP